MSNGFGCFWIRSWFTFCSSLSQVDALEPSHEILLVRDTVNKDNGKKHGKS